MGTRMVGATVARRCRRAGAEAAEHESQNGNTARRPDQRIGLHRSRYAFGRNDSWLRDFVQYPPMFRHRDDPLIGNLDGQSLQSLIKKKLHRYPARYVAFGWIGATFSQASRYRPRRAHAGTRSCRTELTA